MQSMACDAIVRRQPHIEGAANYIADINKPVVINARDGCPFTPPILLMFNLEKKKSFMALLRWPSSEIYPYSGNAILLLDGFAPSVRGAGHYAFYESGKIRAPRSINECGRGH